MQLKCEYCLHPAVSHKLGGVCWECNEDGLGHDCEEFIRPTPEWEHLFYRDESKES